MPKRHGFSCERGELESLAQSALDRARRAGANGCDCEVSEGYGLTVTVRKGKPDTIEHNRDRAIGVSVYFGELDNLGEYLREVHPTVFVGVPRIYEKIVARVQDKAASKGKLNAGLAQWAISVGRQWAQHNSDRRQLPFWLSLKHKLADVVLFKKLRNAMGGRIRILVSGGAALSNDIALAFLGGAFRAPGSPA